MQLMIKNLATLILVVTIASQGNSQSNPRKQSEYSVFRQQTAEEISHLTSIGKLREAKAVVVEKRMLRRPTAGDYRFASILSFELNETSDSLRYWATYDEKISRGVDIGKQLKAEHELLHILLKSPTSSEPISYREFKRNHTDISVRETLVSLMRTATSMFYFRLANLILSELERWQVPDSIMDILRANLDAQVREQARLKGLAG
jgi:hypothetical protein